MHPAFALNTETLTAVWALANDDFERVGMSLVRIDRGVISGPRSDIAASTTLSDSHIKFNPHRFDLDSLKES
jgi:hypothetical protein